MITTLRRARRLAGPALLLAAAAGAAAQDGAYPDARHGGNYMHNYYLPPAPSSTPWAPAWSPDGEWIAFSMHGSIWKVELATGVARELTADAAYHSSPDWSPDGRWIVYTADHGHRRVQLRMLEVGTGETWALTDDEGVYADPAFSPDGRRLAYVSTRPNGHFNVFARAVRDGRWAGEPTAVTSDNDFGRDRLYFGPMDMHISPAWLADGRELLLVSNRGVPLGSGDLLRVPAITQGIVHAETVLSEQTLYRTRPDAHRGRVVYSSTGGAADEFNNLYILPAEGGAPYKLTFFEHDAFHPRWSPDGEWIAFVSNETGLPRLMLLETHGGRLEPVDLAGRRWLRPTGTLKVRVVDPLSGEPAHNRVHLTAADGRFYAPDDAYARVSGRGDPVFHNDGEFSLTLPAGPARLTVVRGFEHFPQTLTVEIAADEVAEEEVRLERLTDMAARGWHSASTHVHANYGGNLRNTLENLMMMSRAEDQDLVLEQVANKDNRILDRRLFVPGGGPHPVSEPDQVVVVGQEYRPPFYGHVFMFGLRDHLISPYVTGYEGTAIDSLYPSNTDMLLKAKAQGAVTGYVHPFAGDGDPLRRDLGRARGFIVDAALGAADALEWSDANRAGFYPLYAAWSNGLKVAAVGGEDSISSLHRSKLIGSFRTYVHTGGTAPDMHAWFDAMKRGRAFVSSGPLLELRAGAAWPGDTVGLERPGPVVLSGRLRSITPVGEARLVCDGETVERFRVGRDNRLDFEHEIEVARSGWCHLRAEGEPEDRFPMDTGYAQAFTNPVWFEVAGEPVRDPEAAEYALEWIDRLEEMADAWPGWRGADQFEHVIGQFERARRVYRGFLD